MADYPTSCTDKSAGIQAPNKQVRKILALIAASRPDALVNWGSCGENASSRQLEKREKKAGDLSENGERVQVKKD